MTDKEVTTKVLRLTESSKNPLGEARQMGLEPLRIEPPPEVVELTVPVICCDCGLAHKHVIEADGHIALTIEPDDDMTQKVRAGSGVQVRPGLIAGWLNAKAVV